MLPLRLLPAAALVAAFLVAVARVGPPPDFDAGRELRRAEALDSRLRTVRLLDEGKARVTALVLEGRMSLREAAQEFGRLQDARDGYEGPLGPVAPPRGDRELCENVMVWARAVSAGDPARAAALARLEREYREQFRTCREPAPGR